MVLHVIDYENLPGYVDWAEKLRELLDDVDRIAHERLQALAKECADRVLDVKILCRTGMTAKEIVSTANEESVDLIVVGTHGRTGVKNLVMGSVARSVLKTAYRPVMIVQGPPDK